MLQAHLFRRLLVYHVIGTSVQRMTSMKMSNCLELGKCSATLQTDYLVISLMVLLSRHIMMIVDTMTYRGYVMPLADMD